jgi:hypothetical protein
MNKKLTIKIKNCEGDCPFFAVEGDEESERTCGLMYVVNVYPIKIPKKSIAKKCPLKNHTFKFKLILNNK